MDKEKDKERVNKNDNKIKISDGTRILSLRTIIEQCILEVHSELTKEDFKNIFDKFFEEEKDLNVFHEVVGSIKEEFLEKLKKRLKLQARNIHQFISKNCEEEKYTRDSETKIIKEEKETELEKFMEEKIKLLLKIIKSLREHKEKSEKFYIDVCDNILENSK